jgi:hypothetical protein
MESATPILARRDAESVVIFLTCADNSLEVTSREGWCADLSGDQCISARGEVLREELV